ncbi:MAG TPA: hypothetical protein PKE65_00405 [Rhizobiaceae bacterium]|nr:hypothetical protein [Rhizobiaceae bacterium]
MKFTSAAQAARVAAVAITWSVLSGGDAFCASAKVLAQTVRDAAPAGAGFHDVSPTLLNARRIDLCFLPGDAANRAAAKLQRSRFTRQGLNDFMRHVCRARFFVRVEGARRHLFVALRHDATRVAGEGHRCATSVAGESFSIVRIPRDFAIPPVFAERNREAVLAAVSRFETAAEAAAKGSRCP